MAFSDSEMVTLVGGHVLPLNVVSRLIEIESRGVRFTLLADGRFQVTPVSALTQEDTAFLKANRKLVRDAVAYCEHMAIRHIQ